MKHVGFIGLGRMGQPMASNLIKAGYQLTVFDISRQAVGALEAKGARSAASPAAVASAVDTVLLSLPTIISRFRNADDPYFTSVSQSGRWAIGAAWLALVVYLGFALVTSQAQLASITHQYGY